jgi:proteasome lid subunit RPN8/RPN11
VGLPRTESQFESWSAAGSPLRIEYPAAVLEEICAEAAEGLARFHHGGTEVGGVLYGVERDGLVRVLDYRRFECEYAFGPRFTLSDRDRERMRELLRAPQRDPELAGTIAVGWYHSHTRSALELSPRDLELSEQLFPAPFQIALVVRPESDSLAQAGFFLHSQPLFVVDVRPRRRLPEELPPGGSEMEPEAETAAPDPGTADSRTEPTSAVDRDPPEDAFAAGRVMPEVAEPAAPEPPPPVPAIERADALASWVQPEAPGSRRWYWGALAVLLLAAGAFGVWRYWAAGRLNAPLSLWVADVGGQLLIEWDRTAGPIRSARSGIIEIRDGGPPKYIPLDPERLREGSVDYVRRSEMVDVKLRVDTASGAHAQELIRFVGQPVLRPAAEDVVKERDELKAEVERLRAEVQRLRGRIRPNATP